MGGAAREACLAKRDADPAGTLLALLREAAGVAKAEMLKSGKRKAESGKWKVESGKWPGAGELRSSWRNKNEKKDLRSSFA
jgi:hypothetical protein